MHDEKLSFSAEQNLASTSASSTAVSTNVLNLGTLTDKRGSTIQNQIGRSRRAVVRVQVENTALKAAGAGTLDIKLFTKASASSMTSGTEIARAAQITTANNSTTNPAGTVLADIPIPDRGMLQYLALGYAVGGNNISAGKVTAWIDMNHESGSGE